MNLFLHIFATYLLIASVTAIVFFTIMKKPTWVARYAAVAAGSAFYLFAF